jgi:hypothetical protein
MRPVALVTGATSGIGLDLARVLAREGHDLILVARRADALHAAADDLTHAHGAAVTVLPGDLAALDTPAAVEAAVRDLGLRVDVLVNNAGVGALGRFTELPLERQLAMVQLNVTAVTDLTRRFLPAMVGRGAGRVLFVASTAAYQPGPLMAVYYATKAYVLSLAVALAEELKGTGVTVTSLNPGPTRTGFQAAADLEGVGLLKVLAMADSAEVAEAGYRALMRGDVECVPGVVNKLGAFSTRLIPRTSAAKIVRLAQES